MCHNMETMLKLKTLITKRGLKAIRSKFGIIFQWGNDSLLTLSKAFYK